MVWLSKLKRTDHYSYDHALDVSIHLMAFGRHLGFPPDQLKLLGVAGLLQDVGKASIPDGLLQKAEALTAGERAVLRRHVEFSTQILATQAGMPREVVQIAARHHERYDGSGYPRRLTGSEIGLSAEMAGLVDTYCAMSYDRPYRRGLDSERVLRKLYASRGRRFAEPLVIEFIQCIGLYPVGTLVELRSGEVAMVVEQNRVRRLKPRVIVILDKAKRPIGSPLSLDLKDEPLAEDGTPYQIRHALGPNSYGIEPREFYL
jgi:HD-GYP domain-containing protein (c-di-GMP phosphodiesterase class II)